ncbi:unnamed protein product [Adineta ricciae]|uniref:SET domain-containing protein n=1 Tax=Adineta ricciae TaxID=249248 RepID=A0A814IF07_ADIRI|nr:unnamed protein product [Adineta ricciae]CAF1022592.1 unnamed protein product [Adineta ricciae]
MPKSRSKIKKTILTPHAAIIGLTDEIDLSICCSNRNCPSHWHDRLTEKLKTLQQSKSKTSPSLVAKTKSIANYKLTYPDILSQLFRIQQSDETDNQEVYSMPIAKSVILEKHNDFSKQVETMLNDSTYSFMKNNLNSQIQYRLIPLVADIFSDQMDRMETATPLKINLLRINHLHLKAYLRLKIISVPIWNRSAVHVIVQDENCHCLHLAIYNWSHIIDTRQIRTLKYIQERLSHLLPMNSYVVLLDPWLKKCRDGDISLRCESPNTHLLLIDFEERCSTSHRTNVEQLRQIGNLCYQVDDNLSAIRYYTFGLKQLDDEQEKELASKGQSIGPKTDEREQHRIRLLSNRCACYLRERHAALALADTGILLAFNELTHILELPKATTGKLLFRCLSAHLYLGLFDKVEGLLKSHKFGVGLSGGENLTTMAILERELIRLRDENTKGRYDLQGMLHKQITNKSPLMFIDLPNHHAECHRNDLFEVRASEELTKNGYPNGSYGVYALKNLDVGTLLVAEQPFASIDHRTIGEEYSHKLNYWNENSTIEYCCSETLRLLNEIEKQLLIGNDTWTTFEKIKSMQPIRRWLAENVKDDLSKQQEENETSSNLPENYEEILSEKKQWRKPFSKRLPPPLPYVPWRVLFETQQQNPYKSQSTLGWYSLGSMFNHSCLPNCTWYLIGDYLFIYVCSTNVRQGDELTISYCPLWISSVNERSTYLERFNIRSCQCSLCTYDRLDLIEYEKDLKKFSNIRALARQKNLSNFNRFVYLQQLHEHYEYLTNRYSNRAVGFVNEFIDLESINQYFQIDSAENEIKEYLNHRQDSFLDRFSHVCRLTLPQISNPILLFGTQIQLLIHHLEHFYSSDYKQWNRLLVYLYEIYTFKCHSVSNDMPTTLKDYKELFTNLTHTQSFFSRTFYKG